MRNTWGEAGSLLAAAPGLLERGEVSKSIGYWEEALSLNDKEGVAVVAVIRPIVAWTYGGLLLGATAYLHMLSGDLRKAKAYLSEAEKLDPETVMDYFGSTVVFRTLMLGGVRLACGDFSSVLAIADEDLSRMREREMRCYLPDVLRKRGEALRGLGRIEEAFASLAEALNEPRPQQSNGP